MKPERDRLNENYLSERFDFFEKHTFLSIYNQTCKNFKWIIMFHSETPQLFKDRIEKLQQKLPQMKILYVPEDKNWSDLLTNFLKEDCQSEWIATSRLDNDDEFESSYEKTLQAIKLKDSDFIISFPDGYIYDNKRNIIIKNTKISNNCITLVARKNSDKIHSLALDHSKICDLDSPFEIKTYRDGKGKWIVNIHDLNLANRTKYSFKNMIWSKEFLYKNSSVNVHTTYEYILYIFREVYLATFYMIWNPIIKTAVKIRNRVCKTV